MTDANQNSGTTIEIPEEVKEKYPDLVDMILKSISMDDDERKYWFSVLPVMSDDQVAELRDILTSEQKKIKEIDKKYDQNTDEAPEISEEDLKKAEEERQKKRQERKQAEAEHQEEVQEEAENLLSELEDL